MSENIGDDLGFAGGLFGSIDLSPSPQVHTTMAFWNELLSQPRAMVLELVGDIDQANSTGMASKLEQGEIYCCATKLNGDHHGYSIRACNAGTENSVKVYWLPWIKGKTTSVNREDVEGQGYQFFMTHKLTGCRFSLTSAELLHIASDAMGALDYSLGSAKRTEAEVAHTGGKPSRRLSISNGEGRDNDFVYERVAIVFGARQHNGTWRYQALRKKCGSTAGEWITFIEPGV